MRPAQKGEGQLGAELAFFCTTLSTGNSQSVRWARRLRRNAGGRSYTGIRRFRSRAESMTGQRPRRK